MADDATTPAEPPAEAFMELFGIAFGLSDIILLAVLGGGALWYFFLRKDNARNDAAANFQSYTIQ